jgi:hypothetical protein
MLRRTDLSRWDVWSNKSEQEKKKCVEDAEDDLGAPKVKRRRQMTIEKMRMRRNGGQGS